MIWPTSFWLPPPSTPMWLITVTWKDCMHLAQAVYSDPQHLDAHAYGSLERNRLMQFFPIFNPYGNKRSYSASCHPLFRINPWDKRIISLRPKRGLGRGKFPLENYCLSETAPEFKLTSYEATNLEALSLLQITYICECSILRKQLHFSWETRSGCLALILFRVSVNACCLFTIFQNMQNLKRANRAETDCF
jgi:hypothetical protein